MARSQFSLNIEVKATERVSKPMKRAEKSVEAFGRTAKKVTTNSAANFKNLAGAFVSLVVAKHAVRAFGSLLSPAIELQTAMGDLSAATGSTGSELQAMRTAALNAAAATKFSPKEAIEGMKVLKLAVKDARTATEAIIPVLTSAQVMFEGKVAPAVELAGRLTRGFGLQGEELTKSFSKVAAASRIAGVTITKLAPGYELAGIAAKMAGASFNDVTTLMALGVNAGLGAKRTMTGLFNAFSKFNKLSVQEKFKELGVNVVDANGNLHNMRVIALNTAKALSSVTGIELLKKKDLLVKALSMRGAKAFIGAMAKLSEGMDVGSKKGLKFEEALIAINNNLENSTGLLDTMREAAMAPFSQQVTLLAQSWVRLRAVAFEPFINMITPLVTGITGIANAIAEAREGGSQLAVWATRITTSLLILTGVIGSLILAKIAWLGVTALIGAALAFAGIEGVGIFATSIVTTAIPAMIAYMGSGVAMIGIGYQLATTQGLVAAGFYTMAAGARTFFLSLLGPIGLLIAVAAVLMPLFGFGEKFSKKLGMKSGSDVDKMKSQADFLAGAAESLRKSSDESGDSMSAFDTSVKLWAKTVKDQTPVLAGKSVGFTGQIAEQIAKFAERTGNAAGAKRTRETFAAAKRTLDEAAMGGDVGKARLSQARIQMSDILKSGNTLAKTGAISVSAERIAKIEKGVDSFFENALTKSKGAAEALMRLGVIEGERSQLFVANQELVNDKIMTSILRMHELQGQLAEARSVFSKTGSFGNEVHAILQKMDAEKVKRAHLDGLEQVQQERRKAELKQNKELQSMSSARSTIAEGKEIVPMDPLNPAIGADSRSELRMLADSMAMASRILAEMNVRQAKGMKVKIDENGGSTLPPGSSMDDKGQSIE